MSQPHSSTDTDLLRNSISSSTLKKPVSFVTDSATSSTFVYENFVSVTGDSAGQSAFGAYYNPNRNYH